jgi:hypothetical protein
MKDQKYFELAELAFTLVSEMGLDIHVTKGDEYINPVMINNSLPPLLVVNVDISVRIHFDEYSGELGDYYIEYPKDGELRRYDECHNNFRSKLSRILLNALNNSREAHER